MVESAVKPPALESSEHSRRSTSAIVELVVGFLLLSLAALGGFVFAYRPRPIWADRIGVRLLPAQAHAGWAVAVAHLDSTPVLVIGIVGLVITASRSRDRMRTMACVLGPMAAIVVTELIAKPLVGRNFEGVLTYPSGTVTAVAALAAGAFIVAPRKTKPVVGAVGLAVVVTVCAAVVVLRWHYPTDAVGGACVGIGVVFALDGALHWFRPDDARRRD